MSSTRRNAITLAILLFAQLLLMAGSVRGVGGATLLESWTLRVSSPVVAVARVVGGFFGGIGSSIGNLLHAHSRNSRLETELAELHGEVQRLRTQAEENRRLRLLLAMAEGMEPQGIAARIVTSSRTGKTGMIVVDRGAADGVEVDAPVVAWGGAVGRVVAVGAGYAKVRLLTDPNSGAGGMTQRTRARGVVTGRGDDPMEMSWVPGLSDVKAGDRVVTSGLDGIYPKGYGIGIVTRVVGKAEGGVAIELRALLDYARLEEVLILPRPVDEQLPEVEGGGEER